MLIPHINCFRLLAPESLLDSRNKVHQKIPPKSIHTFLASYCMNLDAFYSFNTQHCVNDNLQENLRRDTKITHKSSNKTLPTYSALPTFHSHLALVSLIPHRQFFTGSNFDCCPLETQSIIISLGRVKSTLLPGEKEESHREKRRPAGAVKSSVQFLRLKNLLSLLEYYLYNT